MMTKNFILLFFIFTFGVYPTSVNAQIVPTCGAASTTCIEIPHIALAHHAEVEQDPMPVELVDFIWHESPCALRLSSLTGITALKQIPGEIVHIPDSFCTIQGCIGNGLRTENQTTVINECVN